MTDPIDTMRCREIWRAVVAQSVIDVFVRERTWKRERNANGVEVRRIDAQGYKIVAVDERAAVAFWRDDLGPWAESRELACDYGGLDGEALRRHVLLVLESGEDEEIIAAEMRRVSNVISKGRQYDAADADTLRSGPMDRVAVYS